MEKFALKVAELRDETADAWNGMDAKDSLAVIVAGTALGLVGIVFGAAAGNDSVLIAVKALGGIYIGGGATGMVAGVAKSLELQNRPKHKKQRSS